MHQWKPGKMAMNQHQSNKELLNLGKAMAAFVSGSQSNGNKGNGKGGGGKASSKGSSKGNTQPLTSKDAPAKPPQPGQWLCLYSACPWAKQRRWNHSYRNICGGCSTAKGEAMSPPIGSRIVHQHIAPSVSLKGKLRAEALQKGEAEKPRSSVKPSAAETARAEAQTHVPVLASTQALDVKEVAAAVKAVHDEARRIAFTAEQADSFKMVAPALLDVLASLAKERRPAPLRADKDPALTAESFIRDSKPVSKSFDLAKAEDELSKAQAMLGMADEDDPLQETLRARVTKAQDKVSKLTRETPSDNLKAHCLEEILAAYRRSASVRKEKAGKGKENAEARRQERLQWVWQARQELDAFEDALISLDQEVQGQFEEKATELDAYDEAVMAQIQEKVGCDPTVMSVDKSANPLIEQHRKETEEVWARVRKAEKELETAKREAEASAAAGGTSPSASSAQPTIDQSMADWHIDFPAEEEQIPRWAGTPDPAQTAYLLRLLTLSQAAKFSSLPMMSFQQLQVAPWFAHRLVGDVIWLACWGSRAPNISMDHTVPMKLMNVLTHVVAKLDQDLKAQATEEQRLAAATTIKEQREAQLRRMSGKHPRTDAAQDPPAAAAAATTAA